MQQKEDVTYEHIYSSFDLCGLVKSTFKKIQKRFMKCINMKN